MDQRAEREQELRDHIAAMTPRGARLALGRLRDMPADERTLRLVTAFATVLDRRAEQHAIGQSDWEAFREVLDSTARLLSRTQATLVVRQPLAAIVEFGKATELLDAPDLLALLDAPQRQALVGRRTSSSLRRTETGTGGGGEVSAG